MSESFADVLAYYARPGVMTDPQGYAELFDDLPTDIGALCKVVQGVMLHIFWAGSYGVTLSEERKQAVGIRDVATKLAMIRALDDQPLKVTRPPDKRLVGNCRDFSTLLSAILRYQGVPARARCGFGTYFIPNHYEDHWVCEYWKASEQRWVLVDAQLDQLQQEKLGIRFDTLDVPRDQFVIAGQGWQMCRAGQADPDQFGIFDMKGLWFIRGNVVRDMLALNKVEILPWDGGWGLLSQLAENATDEEMEAVLFDRISALTLAGNEAFKEIRALYESEARLHLPAELKPSQMPSV
jgi:hypothetical protein